MITSLREYRPDLPQLALLAANLLPLSGVLFADWDVGAIVLLYWTENVVIGVLTILKMLVTGHLRALPRILFFCLHYGLFCMVHGALALELAGYGVIGNRGAEMSLSIDLARQILPALPREFIWGSLALLFSHGMSFLLLFIGGQEYRHTTVNKLMRAPYRRIVVLHLAIIAGAFLARSLGSPLGLLLALVALKTAFDIMLHIRSHRGAESGRAAGATRQFLSDRQQQSSGPQATGETEWKQD